MQIFIYGAIVFFLAISGCAQPDAPSSQPKIIGGQKAAAQPFMVGLVKPEFGGEFAARVACGGTLIRPDVVVTAAHCVDSMNKGSYVVLGSTSANVPAEKGVKVRAIVTHPQWKGAGNDMLHDIALLFLDDYDAASFAHPVQPLELNRDQALPAEDGRVRVIGWGNSTSLGDVFRDELREVTVPVVPLAACREAYPDVNESQICAGLMEAGGADSCQGDSGGPLVAEHEGIIQLVGVVSFGDGCAQKKKPGVYTRVSAFADWIDQTISEHMLTSPPAGKVLSRLIQSHCLEGFSSVTLAGSENQGFLTLTRKFLPGASFIPKAFAGTQAEVRSLSRCEFSVKVGEADLKITAEVLESSSGTRFEAMVGDKAYAAAARSDTGINLTCSSAGEFFMNYDPAAGYSYLNTSAGNFFVGTEWDENISIFSSVASCEVGTTSASLVNFQESHLLVLTSPALDGGLKVLQVYPEGKHDDGLSGVSMSIKIQPAGTSSGSTGALRFTNSSDTDIFSWQLDCDRQLVLEDEFGAVYLPQERNGRFVHDFISPAYRIGTFLAGQELALNFSASTVIQADALPVCMINGMTIVTTLDAP